MKLHVFPPSPRAAKVLALVHHLGLDCEVAIVDLLNGGNQTPAFKALNPNGKMPVLEDDGFVLWESNAILQYLGAKKPESGVWPTDPRRQADVARWQFWDAAHWDPTCATFIFERVVKQLTGQGAPDAAQVAKAETDFARFAPVLNATLKGRRWVTGDTLTVADFGLGGPLMYAAPAAIPLADYPEIARWYAALAELPGWKKASPAPPG
ncbi:MAG: glutathione S-transferase family protein [Candidatus Binatia bacterium]